MAWKKNSPEQIQRFEELVSVKGAKRETMFGCPVWALGGERYAVLHEGRIALRLPEKDGAALIAKGGTQWEPIRGRKSKDKFVVPESIVSDARAMKKWVSLAVKYARGG
jgi:hypothetical protein